MSIRHKFFVASLAIAFAAVQLASAQVTNPGFETGGGSFTGWGSAGDNFVVTNTLGTGPVEGTHDALLATATDGSGVGVPAGTGATAASVESLLAVSSGTLLSVGNGTPVLSSAISQTVSLTAGQVVTFSWDFLTNQTYNDGTHDSIAPSTTNNDFAFSTLALVGNPGGRQISKLADTFFGFGVNPGNPGGFDTGFTITPASNPFISETGFHTFSWTIGTTGNYVLGVGVVHATTTPDDGVNSAVLVDHFVVTPEPAPFAAVGLLCLGLIRRRKSGARR